MPEKFPEVVLSRECSHSMPPHFDVNCTHKASHFSHAYIFPDMTDGQGHFIILQGSMRLFFISCLSSFYTISFSWLLITLKFPLIFFFLSRMKGKKKLSKTNICVYQSSLKNSILYHSNRALPSKIFIFLKIYYLPSAENGTQSSLKGPNSSPLQDGQTHSGHMKVETKKELTICFRV